MMRFGPSAWHCSTKATSHNSPASRTISASNKGSPSGPSSRCPPSPSGWGSTAPWETHKTPNRHSGKSWLGSSIKAPDSPPCDWRELTPLAMCWDWKPLMKTTCIATSIGSTRIKRQSKTACFVCVIPMAKPNCSSTTSPAVIWKAPKTNWPPSATIATERTASGKSSSACYATRPVGRCRLRFLPGNTADTSTFASQVRKVADRFGGGAVTLVGDRGMIKGPQIDCLQAEEGEFHYITAITKPQIESLLTRGLFQLELFDEKVAEVHDEEEEVRYVLRRNPLRAAEMAATREGKREAVEKLVSEQNVYLAEHPRARVDVADAACGAEDRKVRLSTWLSVSSEGRTLSLVRDEDALAEATKLDGCYCLKTDLDSQAATKELVHDRYKSLAEVEWAFRTCKTSHLEVRPVLRAQGIADTGARVCRDVGLPDRDGAGQMLARPQSDRGRRRVRIEQPVHDRSDDPGRDHHQPSPHAPSLRQTFAEGRRR